MPALLPDPLISLVSHSTFSYSILCLHCCQVHSCPWSATALSHTLSCACTASRYTHVLSQPQHLLMLYLVPGHIIQHFFFCTSSVLQTPLSLWPSSNSNIHGMFLFHWVNASFCAYQSSYNFHHVNVHTQSCCATD